MKEHPILFSGEMVRAILEGRKTQTRQVSMYQDFLFTENGIATQNTSVACPYGQVGDRLWVRETWAANVPGCESQGGYSYRADHVTGNDGPTQIKWKPSIYMPRKASRITLEITDIRIERLQDISEEDAIAEGIEIIEGTNVWKNYQIPYPSGWLYPHLPIDSFRTLWDSVYSSWKVNPWVWVIEFKQI